jgi:hypothetical protein
VASFKDVLTTIKLEAVIATVNNKPLTAWIALYQLGVEI